tara:strand:- start:61 stop:471 length:411 start_codon:yes stop_codon:yes gene_type:complete
VGAKRPRPLRYQSKAKGISSAFPVEEFAEEIAKDSEVLVVEVIASQDESRREENRDALPTIGLAHFGVIGRIDLRWFHSESFSVSVQCLDGWGVSIATFRSLLGRGAWSVCGKMLARVFGGFGVESSSAAVSKVAD